MLHHLGLFFSWIAFRIVESSNIFVDVLSYTRIFDSYVHRYIKMNYAFGYDSCCFCNLVTYVYRKYKCCLLFDKTK